VVFNVDLGLFLFLEDHLIRSKDSGCSGSPALISCIGAVLGWYIDTDWASTGCLALKGAHWIVTWLKVLWDGRQREKSGTGRATVSRREFPIAQSSSH
jgi:hypothetical protein